MIVEHKLMSTGKTVTKLDCRYGRRLMEAAYLLTFHLACMLHKNRDYSADSASDKP